MLAIENQNGSARARHRQVRESHDLARLPSHLPFLLRVLVVEEFVDVGDDVERQRMREDLE